LSGVHLGGEMTIARQAKLNMFIFQAGQISPAFFLCARHDV
jgi:hypothetical protein